MFQNTYWSMDLIVWKTERRGKWASDSKAKQDRKIKCVWRGYGEGRAGGTRLSPMPSALTCEDLQRTIRGHLAEMKLPQHHCNNPPIQQPLWTTACQVPHSTRNQEQKEKKEKIPLQLFCFWKGQKADTLLVCPRTGVHWIWGAATTSADGPMGGAHAVGVRSEWKRRCTVGVAVRWGRACLCVFDKSARHSTMTRIHI